MDGGAAARWRRMRRAAAGPQFAGLHELVEAAFGEPVLRALAPGTSMHWLRFSRRATRPRCADLPWVVPVGNGRYRVRTAGGRTRETTGVAETVGLILALLPAGVRN
ncbi:DUF6193 family natural product biosynthesis protein [Streptomyces sp. NPDC058611]|uniref:DUF6193 family natural product biosynthesis protein n=1 Tax=unclassified Streptomyces TaxID=2593676 RepID=UPI00365B3448